MEPHVKERIVGAAILVALGVWLIPWVLDGPDEAIESGQSASDEILPAAAETTPVRNETVELDPAPAAASTRGVRAPDSAGGLGAEGRSGASEPAGDEPSVAAAESGAAAGSDAAAGSGAEAGSAAAVESAAAVDRESEDSDAADAADPANAGSEPVAAVAAGERAAAAPQADRPVPPPAAPDRSASSRDGWQVQLGAFGDLTNADQLAARISTYGYSAYVAEFRSGGEIMHRVRVGGFDSEREADAAASSLSAHGFPGRVISPE